MMGDVLKELAALIRAEAGNCIAPVQAALNGLAARLEAKAAERDKPRDFIKHPLYVVDDEPSKDADVAIVSISDELEIED